MAANLDPSKALSRDELDPIQFQLVNGRRVTFACQRFWTQPSAAERQDGQVPVEVKAIRVFAHDDSPVHGTTAAYEFRIGIDVEAVALRPSWSWLVNLTKSRELYDYDSLDELVEEFARILEAAAVEVDNAVAHYQRLNKLLVRNVHPGPRDPGDTASEDAHA